MIRAIVFDLDGVLVDAREWHYAAFDRAIGMFGFHVGGLEHAEVYDGLPTRRKLELLTERNGFPKSLHGLVSEVKQQETRKMILERCKMDSEVVNAVRGLLRDGYRLAVASNAIRESVEGMLAMSGLARHFEFCLSNQDVPRGKPDPGVYLEAAKRLGMDPDECLAVEDNENGFRSALSARFHLCKVSSPHDWSRDDAARVREAIGIADMTIRT